MQNLFTIPELCPIRDSMTISRNASIDSCHRITYFSYLGAFETGNFLLKSISRKNPLRSGDPERTGLHGNHFRKGEHHEPIIKNE